MTDPPPKVTFKDLWPNLMIGLRCPGYQKAVEAKLHKSVLSNMTGIVAPERSLHAATPRTAVTIRAAVVVALLAALFWDVLRDLAVDWWTFDAYSQGMLLPPLALYIAWLNRRQTFAIPAATDTRGILLIAFACVMYIAGKLASEFFLMRISFVAILAGLLWAFWGMQRLKTVSLPVLLLATMVPLPAIVYNSLAAPLQLYASEMATRIAQAFGVSIYRDGNILQLAEVTLGVAEACSGLNSLSALIVGSVLLGYLLCTAIASRVLLLLSSVPLAIAVNIIRVAGTAVLADINQEFAMGFYHSFSGWFVFVLGFALLYAFARILHWTVDRRQAS